MKVIFLSFIVKGVYISERVRQPDRKHFPGHNMGYQFLLTCRNTVLHTSTESRRWSHNYVKNPRSGTTSHMSLPPSNASNPLHPTYYDRKRDTQAEHINLRKTALWNTIWNVNFVDPTQIKKAHEGLMCETNREVRYILWLNMVYGCNPYILSGTNSSQH